MAVRPVAGLAITHRALGNTDEAVHLWRTLVENDTRYTDVDWARGELDWNDTLTDEARKVVALLDAN
jgi:hypothetical protein